MDGVKTRLLLLLLIAFIGKSWAIEDVYSSRTSVFVPNVTSVQAKDGKYNDMLTTPWWENFKNEDINGYVIFELDSSTLKSQTSNLDVTLTVKIDYEYFDGTAYVQGSANNIDLNVTYNATGSDVITPKAFYKIEGAHYVKATVVAINGDGSIMSGTKLSLVSKVVVERHYNFDRTATATVSTPIFESSTNRIKVNWAGIPNAVEYDLEWVHYNNYDAAGLGGVISAANFNLPEKPFAQAARISTKETSYSIPMVFDKGFVLFRVRGKGRVNGDNYTRIHEGVWSSNPQDLSSATYFEVSNGHELDKNWNYQAVFTESGKNKYAVTYSDGSGRSRQTVVRQNDRDESIVSEVYYDAQGRPIVEALPAPTDTPKIKFFPAFNRDSASANVYDVSGLDAYDVGCESTSIAMKENTNASSTAMYYSPSNPDNSLEKDMYVPDAGGYPFTQTLYTADNTGRVAAKALPGEDFKMGSGKETKHIYAIPFQSELDLLFGSDVGYAYKYKKNITVDANGQASITYVDPNDQTIATSVYGGAPDNMSDLPEFSEEGLTYDAELLGKRHSSDPVGQLENIDYKNGVRTFSRVIPLLSGNTQTFNYSVVGDKHQQECAEGEEEPICYECVLDVEISLKDQCGKEYLSGIDDGEPTKFEIGSNVGDFTNCTSSFSDNQSLVATYGGSNPPSGAYNLRKTLKIDYDKLDEYTKHYLNSDSCLKSKADFRAEQLALLKATTNCDTSCSTCKDNLGELYADSQFNPDNNPDCDPCITKAQYDELILECEQNCEVADLCEKKYHMLLADVSPGGQYGLVRESPKLTIDEEITEQGDRIEPWKFPLSVFNTNNKLPMRQLEDSTSTNYNIFLPNWRHPVDVGIDGRYGTPKPDGAFKPNHYLDERGNPYRVYLTKEADGSYSPEYIGSVLTDVNGGKYVYPENLKYIEDFLRIWKPQWAEQLVAYHPEFGYYQYCQLMSASNDFDDLLRSAENLESLPLEIRNSIGSSHDNSLFFTEIDPFFSDEGYHYSLDVSDLGNAMEDKLDNYAVKNSTTFSIWQMSWVMANCNDLSAPCSTQCLGSIPSPIPIDNSNWEQFRALYLSAKQEIMMHHQHEKAISGEYPTSSGQILPSYSECIGNRYFNKFRYDFFQKPIPVTVNTSPFSWFNRFVTYMIQAPNSQYLNPSQPCNKETYLLFSKKDPRFTNRMSGTNIDELASEACENLDKYHPEGCPEKTEAVLEEMEKESQVQRYLQCGQCPLAYDLEMLLNGIIKNPDPAIRLTGNFPLGCDIAELTDDLNVALVNDPGITTPQSGLEWENIGSDEALIINILNGGCQPIQFPDIGDLDITYNDIDEICCIKGTSSNGSFQFTIKYYDINEQRDTSVTLQAIQQEGCLDLLNCDFGEKCSLTATGKEVQDLFNTLLYDDDGDGSIDLFYGNSTTSGIESDYYKTVMGNRIFDYLRNAIVLNQSTSLTWNVITSTTTTLVANVSSSCDFKLELISPSTGNIGDITYFYNIRPDKSSNSDYQFLISGTNDAGEEFELIGTSCIKVKKCRSYLEQDFFASNDRVTEEICDTTAMFNQVTSYVKNLSFASLSGNLAIVTMPIGDPEGPSGDCNLNLELIYSTKVNKDLGDVAEVLGTYKAQGENDYNQIHLSVLFNDGSSGVIALTSPCGPFFSCFTPSVKDMSSSCETYGILDEIEQNFINYINNNIASIVDDGGRYLLDGLIPGCDVYIYQGVKFDNVPHQLGYLHLQKQAVEVLTDGSTEIRKIHDIYIDETPDEFGNLTSAYLVAEMDNGELVQFKLETNPSCPLGKCGECYTENLIDNGDFEFDNKAINDYFFPSFVDNSNFITGSNRSNLPNNTMSALDYRYTIVTYNNYYKHLDTNSNNEPYIAARDAWSACYNLLPDTGLHSTISTHTTKSMEGNFYLVQVQHGLISPKVVWEQELSGINSAQTQKDYTFSMDIMRFVEYSIGFYEDHCIYGIEVHIDGVKYTINDINDNLFSNWLNELEAAQCTSATHGIMRLHNKNDKWDIDWKEIKIPFSSSKNNIPINIKLIATQTDPNYSGNVTNSCSSGETYFWGFDNIAVREKPCNAAFASALCHPQDPPQIELDSLMPTCLEEIENTADYNANVLYDRYIDSVRQDFREGYIEKCLNIKEDLSMPHEEGEHHYTLYYYDQAGNLVRTVPPKGVKKLETENLSEVSENRANNKKTVFTEHTMATTYAYNSLGQLVQQSVPDHEDLEIFETELFNNSNSLPPNMNVRDMHFMNTQKGIVVGFVDPVTENRGLIYTTNDGGKSWQKASTTGTDDYNYIDPFKTWIVGDNGQFLYFDNSEWLKRTVPTIENLIYVTEDQDRVVYVFSENGRQWYSEDNGMSWVGPNADLASRINGKVRAYIIDRHNVIEGYAVTNEGEIFYTDDRGVSWQARESIRSTNLNTIAKSASNLYISGAGGRILESDINENLNDLNADIEGDIKELYIENNLWYAVYQDPQSGFYELKTSNDGKAWNSAPTFGTQVQDIFIETSGNGYLLTADELRDLSALGGTPIHSYTGSNPYFRSVFVKGTEKYIGTSDGEIEYDIGSGWNSPVTILSPSEEIIELSINNSTNPNGVLLTASNNIYTTIQAPSSSWTWSQLQGNYLGDQFVDMHFFNLTHGLALTDQGKVIKTTSGGVNWTTILDLQDASAPFQSIYISSFGSSGKGAIVGDNGEVWKTTDGGSTWVDISANVNPQGLSDIVIDGSKIYTVGENGTIIKSTDEGMSWSYLESENKNDLKAIDVNSNNGLVVGDEVIIDIASGLINGTNSSVTNSYTDVIFHSGGTSYFLHEDGAEHGSFLSQSPYSALNATEKLNAIANVSNTLMVVGDNGIMHERIYNGTSYTWALANEFEPNNLVSVYAITNNKLIVGGKDGYLAKSNDGGNSWTEFSPKIPASYGSGSITHIYFSDENNGIVITNKGQAMIYNSSNTNNPWEFAKVDFGSNIIDFNLGTGYRLHDIQMLSQDKGVILGKGFLYYTNDGIDGTWKRLAASYGSNELFALFMVDEDYGFASGNNGSVYKITRNSAGALQMASVSPTYSRPNNFNMRTLYFMDRQRGYGVNNLGELFITTDGGQNWEHYDVDGNGTTTQTPLFDVYFTQLGQGFFAGNGGTIGTITDFSNYFSDRFYYDKLGRMVASQNAKQYNKGDNVYSYTLYDALGRIIEVGELEAGPNEPIEKNYNNQLLDQLLFESWVNGAVRSQITRTYYDNPMGCSSDAIQQENLRSRVASTTYNETDDGECNYDIATHYSYDVHGNVKTLYQEFPELDYLEQRWKQIDYKYDLISGNVLEVHYQAGENDEFYHKYEYDGDNRIVKVLTSNNGWQWDEDASYEYYRHGPLKRTELGEWDVQGIDYAYTIQGWLKGVNSNSMRRNRDMGRDAIASANNHAEVARDAYGFNLGYYNGDYSAIGSPAEDFEAEIGETGTGSYIANNMKQLYNGNISYMTTAFVDNSSDPMGPQAMLYEYDQLNRIKSAESYTRMNIGSNSWVSANPLDQRYNTTYDYDANGNLLHLNRNDENSDLMDQFDYKYHHNDFQATSGSNWGGKNTNRLLAVEDNVSNGSSLKDIQSGQNFDASALEHNNYEYDEIGNLIKDEQEKIEEIVWTVSGKVKEIIRRAEPEVGSDIEFFYDAQGNRVRKIVKPRDEGDGQLLDESKWTETYYIRDAQGNILSTYEKKYTGEVPEFQESLTQTEVNLFGSDRLGTYNRDQLVADLNFHSPLSAVGEFVEKSDMELDYIAELDANFIYKGKKRYELKNHLGNVLAVIHDYKTPKTKQETTSNVLFNVDYRESEGVTGEWERYRDADLSWEDGVVVEVNAMESGIIQDVNEYFTDAPSNCSYEYCVTFEGREPPKLKFVTLNSDKEIMEVFEVSELNPCFTFSADEVSFIGFIWADEQRGTFTLLNETLTQNCTGQVFDYFEPVVKLRQDYYPFGMLMGGRTSSSGSYRYGFNGKERDDEVKGNGNSYDFGARIYDSRIGRFLSIDPLSVEFPYWSPYLFAANNPIMYIDRNGEDPREAGKVLNIDFSSAVVITSSHDGKAFFKKINDKDLYNKADKTAFLYTIPSLALRLLKGPSSKLPDPITGGRESLFEDAITGHLGSKGDVAEGFIAASQSNNYSFLEGVKNEEGLTTGLIERRVSNLGKGFESEVVYKAEYSVQYSLNSEGGITATSTLEKETYISLLPGKNEKSQQYKIVTFDYSGDEVKTDISYKIAEPRKDNTEGLD